MNWKKAMIGTLVGLTVSLGLVAAKANAPSGTADNATGPGHMGQHIIKALGLNADQTTQFRQMFQQHVAAMKAEKERFETQVDGILTPDQQAKFKDLMQKRQERMKAFFGGGHRWGGGAMGGLKQLNLSADQQAQVKTIMQDMRTKLAAAAPGDNATRQQIRQDMRAQMAKVLTPDQLNQWNQLKQTWQSRHAAKACPSQTQ